jgi:uncharacterized protein HemX
MNKKSERNPSSPSAVPPRATARHDTKTSLVLVTILLGLSVAGVLGGQAWSDRAQELREHEVLRQKALPRLPEIVITASRLEV